MFAAITGLAISANAKITRKPDAAAAKPAATTMGECHNMNECKGTGECGGQGHGCAGMNECKGKGWVSLTEKDCKSKKGQWKKSAGMMHGKQEAPKTETKTQPPAVKK
jgi:hypothetical protein